MEAGNGSVRFTLAERQLRLFKTALQSLNKIGNDLLLEALTGRLVLRSINSSRSAYMSVSFDARFFDEYHVFNCTVVQAGILMKHILSTFRTQRVNKIVFELKTLDSRATVTLFCDNGLLKSYKIPSMDTEILQATVDKEAFPTCVVAEGGAMNKLLSSFHSGLEEVTIIAYGDAGRQRGTQASKAVQLHSFLDPLKGHVDKSLFTQLAVDTREVFLSYSHNSDADADVTFNLKDFRAMLGLCENLGSNVMLRFEGPGHPLVVEPHFPTIQGQEVDYEAELILATLMESHGLPRMTDGDAAPEQQQQHVSAPPNGGTAPGADSWLGPAGSARFLAEHPPASVSRGAASLSGLRDFAPGSAPRIAGRLGASGAAHLDSPRGTGSPLVVPSGLLDDPFQPPAATDGVAPQQPQEQQTVFSRRGRPSRLGQAAGSGRQSMVAGGSVGRAPAAEPGWRAEAAEGTEQQGHEEEEVPSTPPDEQQQREGQETTAVPGVIPTWGPRH